MSSILVRPDIIFSETRIGLCTHNVANPLSRLVTQSATKSVTNFFHLRCMEKHSFGYWLRLRRKALDLTQDALADRVGCSVGLIRKIEAEERRPSAQIVERLADIFSIPQEEQTAFRRFARGELRSAPADTEENFPWHTTTESTRTNLPATVTSFIGREQEIGEVRAYLSDPKIRLVTLVGPPGIGKTRLSIEVARAALQDFPEGVFFVALAPLEDPNLIASAVAQALGYVGARNISTTEQLKEGIGDKQMLLVLDNCEHLIEDVASFASDLLSACPQLKILATSRESLRILGEWLYPVPALDVPAETSSVNVESASKFPALTLFAERARAVRSDFSLSTDNIETIAEICAHLDGLPLVIELIAARIRLMTPQALLAHLSAQFVLTADGMRAAAERQKTLHNAIDWSYKLLPPEEQKLFAYLSVFSSGFTLEAVEAIFSQKITEKPLPNLLALLLDKSLLKLAPDLEASGETRYTMLVTIREYARERLREMGEEAEIRNEHLVYFLDFAEKARKEMRGPNQIEWLHRLLGLRDNLRAALDWAIEAGQTEMALQIARNLHWFWFVHSDHNEARYSFARVLGLSGISLYPSLHAEVLTQFAHHIGVQTGQNMEAKPFVEQALVIARAHDDKRNIGRALSILGYLLTFGEFEGELMLAQSVLEESMELFREVNDEWEYAQTVITLARNAFKQDELALSFTLHEQALALFRKIGDRYFQSWAIYYMGMIEAKQGNVKGGIAKLQEALMLARQLDSKYAVGGGLWRLSELAQRTGDPARTVQLCWAAKNILDSIGAWNEENESDFEKTMASCRAALSEAEFEEAVEQGRAMTMEQAIAYALESRDV
jgi:predicted ATPase/transcriptional regulator with XRE-family HTH domain